MYLMIIGFVSIIKLSQRSILRRALNNKKRFASHYQNKLKLGSKKSEKLLDKAQSLLFHLNLFQYKGIMKKLSLIYMFKTL